MKEQPPSLNNNSSSKSTDLVHISEILKSNRELTGERSYRPAIKSKFPNGSFSQVPISLIRCKQLRPTERVVLMGLISYDWGHKGCFPSQETIATTLGPSVRTVRRALDKLRSLGLISWKKRGLSQTNCYRINYELILCLENAGHTQLGQNDSSIGSPLTSLRGHPRPKEIDKDEIDEEEMPQNQINNNQVIKGEVGRDGGTEVTEPLLLKGVCPLNPNCRASFGKCPTCLIRIKSGISSIDIWWIKQGREPSLKTQQRLKKQAG